MITSDILYWALTIYNELFIRLAKMLNNAQQDLVKQKKVNSTIFRLIMGSAPVSKG